MPWMGVAYNAGVQDWSVYRTLAFDVYALEGPFQLYICISDALHCNEPEKRFNRTLTIHAGWDRIRNPLADVENGPRLGTLTMSTIRKVAFYM